MALPWDNPEHDVIADVKAHVKSIKDEHYKGLGKKTHWPVQKSDCVAIVSGGLDSTTLVYQLVEEGHTPHLVSFDYGQRHSKELLFAYNTAERLGLTHNFVDLTGITHLISNSALTSQTGLTVRGMNFDGEKFIKDIKVPDGHYAEETMKQTVVPNRNMIMLAIAGGIAVNNNYQFLAIGVHAGDHFIYPDCRPRFINAANAAIVIGNSGFGPIPEQTDGTWPFPEDYIRAPFIRSSKADIAYRALELGVPLHLTWSCYKGGDKHCGRCGTCVERLEAIDNAMLRWANNQNHFVVYAPKGQGGLLTDQTEYEDTEFWKQAVREARTNG